MSGSYFIYNVWFKSYMHFSFPLPHILAFLKMDKTELRAVCAIYKIILFCDIQVIKLHLVNNI